MEKIIIEITNDPKAIDSTIDKLRKLGQVDDDNAKKFNAHHEEFTKQTKAKIGLFGELEGGVEHWGEGLEKRFERITQFIVASFAVDRIADFTVEAVKAAAEVQKAYEQLKFSVTTINGATHEQFEQLTKQSEELSKSLDNIYTPTDIQNVQTMLANFGLTSDEIQKVTPRILDLSRATGKTLVDATNEAILAFNGETKGLRTIGVTFHDTGDKLQNYNKFMEQTSKYQGAANDSLNTSQGILDSVAGKWQMLKEKVGGFLESLVGVEQSTYADQLEKEKDSLNVLVEKIEQTNEKDADRKKLIDELQAQYPDFLGNLNAETVTNEQLANRLSEVNKQYLLKIAMARLDEQNKDKLQEQADAQIQSAAAQTKFLMQVSQAAGSANMTLKQLQDTFAKFRKLDFSNPEDVTALYQQAQGLGLSAKNAESLADAYTDYYAKLTKAKVADKDANKLLQEREQILANLEKFYGVNLEPDKDHQKELGMTEKGEQEKKAALEKALKARLELQKKYAEELKKIQDTVEKGGEATTPEEKENRRYAEESRALEDEITKLQEIKEKGTAIQKQQALDAETALDKLIEEARKKHIENLQKIEAEATLKKLEAKLNDGKKMIELTQQTDDLEADAAKRDLKKRLDDKKLTEIQYQVELDKLQVAHDTDKLLHDQLEGDLERSLLKAKYDANLITYQGYQNGLHEIDNKILGDQNQLANDQMKLNEDTQKSYKDTWKKIAEAVQDASGIIFQLIDNTIEEQAKANDYRISQQDSTIEVEKALAEKGLTNDLAFEERRRAALTEQQIKLQIQQKKMKELQAFLNAFVKFTETDPKTAFLKASEVIAEMKIAEAVYSEEGGIIGRNDRTSFIGAWGMSKRHRSGNDVLVHGEKGEGILSVPEMNNLGNDNFLALKAMLKNPFRDTLIPSASLGAMDGNQAILQKLDEVQQAILNKKEQHVDWEGLDMRISTIEKGIKNTIIYKHRS